MKLVTLNPIAQTLVYSLREQREIIDRRPDAPMNDFVIDRFITVNQQVPHAGKFGKAFGQRRVKDAGFPGVPEGG